MLLGCVGDDFTGASDLANTLAKEGMRTTLFCGVPAGGADGVEAGVVALKSRTIPPAEAVRLSLAAVDWLEAQGARQFFFKYCSTFDSTPEGNIGPVIEALLERLGTDAAVVCPAFPATGRTVYRGHLFVGDRLLNESGMENHPLTPMTDPDIRRWLGRQMRRPVGHVGAATVLAGAEAIAAAIGAEAAAGRAAVVVDAIRDEDLRAIGRAARGRRLVTGGSGVALGLPANFAEAGLLAGGAAPWRGRRGRAAILAGSCSAATRGQVAAHRGPARAVDPEALLAGAETAAAAAAWALAQADTPLVFSSADPAIVAAAQARRGREAVAAAVEGFFAETARRLTAAGVERLIVAGGETAGAVVEGLGLTALGVGPEIAPGVPALAAADRPLALALKSGNFGGPDFFAEAARALAGSEAAREG